MENRLASSRSTRDANEQFALQGFISVVIENRFIPKAIGILTNGHQEDLHFTHNIMCKRIEMLLQEDVRWTSEENREPLHAALFLPLLRISFDFNQLQINRPRRIKLDAKVGVYVLREFLLG